MNIKLLKLGHSTRQMDVPAGSSVEQVLHEAQIGHQGFSLTLNGLGVGPEAQLSDGDILTLVPKVEGGSL